MLPLLPPVQQQQQQLLLLLQEQQQQQLKQQQRQQLQQQQQRLLTASARQRPLERPGGGPLRGAPLKTAREDGLAALEQVTWHRPSGGGQLAANPTSRAG
ncbi:hypothetical protein Efla_000494 [Eimeria flavescens]